MCAAAAEYHVGVRSAYSTACCHPAAPAARRLAATHSRHTADRSGRPGRSPPRRGAAPAGWPGAEACARAGSSGPTRSARCNAVSSRVWRKSVRKSPRSPARSPMPSPSCSTRTAPTFTDPCSSSTAAQTPRYAPKRSDTPHWPRQLRARHTRRPQRSGSLPSRPLRRTTSSVRSPPSACWRTGRPDPYARLPTWPQSRSHAERRLRARLSRAFRVVGRLKDPVTVSQAGHALVRGQHAISLPLSGVSPGRSARWAVPHPSECYGREFKWRQAASGPSDAVPALSRPADTAIFEERFVVSRTTTSVPGRAPPSSPPSVHGR